MFADKKKKIMESFSICAKSLPQNIYIQYDSIANKNEIILISLQGITYWWDIIEKFLRWR